MARSFDEEYYDRVREYQKTEPYQKALRKRKVWIEPLFGEAKQWHRMERLRLRMLERTNCEVLIVATGQNIKRLLTFGPRGPRKLAQAAALRPPGSPLLDLDRRRYRTRHRLFMQHRGVFQQAARNHTFLPVTALHLRV